MIDKNHTENGKRNRISERFCWEFAEKPLSFSLSHQLVRPGGRPRNSDHLAAAIHYGFSAEKPMVFIRP